MMPLPPGQPERRAGKVDEALANTQRLTTLIQIVGLALALYVAIAVTVASVYGVLNAIQSSKNAKLGAEYARQALEQARVNEGISTDVRNLVAAQGPCLAGDPPESPACVRQNRTNEVVSGAVEAIRKTIEMHDLNARAAHEILSRSRRTNTTIAPRTAITSPPRSTVPTRPPSTTTTTCPKRGNTGKCK